MKRLGVNIDHIATLRQVRGTPYPDMVQAAEAAILGGADQITVHLREDRRHIQDRDVENLKESLSVPLNLEMAATDEMLVIAMRLKPHLVTLVPEKRHELTTEGGLNVVTHFHQLLPKVKQLQQAGIDVSLFLDPNERQISAACEMGVPLVELHTGNSEEELQLLQRAATFAATARLRVSAGHGLNRQNLAAVVKALPQVEEYNIGHAIVADALFMGLTESVRAFKQILEET